MFKKITNLLNDFEKDDNYYKSNPWNIDFYEGRGKFDYYEGGIAALKTLKIWLTKHIKETIKELSILSIKEKEDTWKKWSIWTLDEEEIQMVAKELKVEIPKGKMEEVSRQFKKKVEADLSDFWEAFLKDSIEQVLKIKV